MTHLKTFIMKKSILKSMTALLFMSLLTISCNKSTDSDASNNSSESEDTAKAKHPDSAFSDSTDLEKVDAARMSDGKDAVQGEVVPPNSSEQK